MEAPEKNKTEMIAGQKNKTEMIASRVKIKAIRQISLADGTVVTPGTIVEVSEQEAKAIIDRRARGPYSFSGERVGNVESDRHDIRRAVRV